MDDKEINRNLIFSSLIWKALEKVFSQGCNLVIQIVLARILLPSDFGNLAIILALVNYLSIFVQSGLSTAIIQKKNISQTDINTLFTISIGVAAFCYGFFYVSSPLIADFYHNPSLLRPIRVVSTVLFLYSYNSIQQGILFRRMDFKLIFWRTAVSVPVSGVVGIYMAYCGYGLWALIANFILSILLASIVMAVGTNVKVRIQFSWKSAKELYSFSLKILVAGLISGFSDLFRTMSIGRKYTASELAYYDRAYTYALVALQIVNNTIQSVLLPVFSRKQENIYELKTLSRKSIRITIFFVTPLLFGAAAVAKPLISVLLTDKWLPCAPFFMLFCLFRWSGCVVGIDKQVILALGKSSIIMYYEAFLLCMNVIMLLITIPISVKAIAIGALIVEYTGSFVIVLISKNVYSYTLRERMEDVVRPILNSIVMMATIYLIGIADYTILWTLIFQVSTGVVVYIIMALITKDSSLKYCFDLVKNKIYFT